MNILTHVAVPFKWLCEYKERKWAMGVTSGCKKQAPHENVTIDCETAELLRQFQAKTGLEMDMLVKQAVDRMYRDIQM